MLFSGISFLYYFLPTVLTVYFLAPKRMKNAVLLLFSLFFYAWGEPKYVLLMIASILSCYVFGLLIDRYRADFGRFFLLLSVIFHVGLLACFKYADFFAETLNAVTGLSLPFLNLSLPIGISFYTFQILSYTADVYRGEAAQKNLISLAAYISMFPQLIAGPIVRYQDVAEQLKDRTHSFDKAAQGIRRFVVGLAKKILIANAMGELCTIFQASNEKSILFYWLYAIAFTLQIYYDFSGYSDMAIGLGKLFGFEFMENFNYPYISGSITEFWRRWHISLGSWFRDYVYIPLGGNRVSSVRWLGNILLVWLLTGLWHGAAWKFIVWGLSFAVLLVIEKLWLLKYLKKSRVLKYVYVLFFVTVSFVIFQAADLRTALSEIGGMFGIGGLPLVSAEFFYYLRSFAGVFLLAVIGATPLSKAVLARLYTKQEVSVCLSVAEPIIFVLLLIVMTAYLVDGSFNPFLYFRF